MPNSRGRRFLVRSVCWLCWTPALAAATSVTGEVYDVRTGAVIPGATITLGGEAATAGPDGIFKLIAAPREPSSANTFTSSKVVPSLPTRSGFG